MAICAVMVQTSGSLLPSAFISVVEFIGFNSLDKTYYSESTTEQEALESSSM